MSRQTKKATAPRLNRFQKAIQATPEVAGNCKPGLQALGNYSSKVKVGDSKQLGGSIDIDQSTKSLYPESSRWDYAFDYAESTYFVEVHAADTSEVTTVLNKLAWLKSWLKAKAPEIAKLRAERHPYIWIASGSVKILPSSKESKRLAQSGLKLTTPLHLK
ncbi:MAG: hypothetical protein LBN24_03205 [Mediterranea sp.]|jgi:hypothetical protein|nr:hypothetical protein [Mediterranea sp.]